MKDQKHPCAGFTAAPPGWRVAYRPAPGDRNGLVLPMAGWLAVESHPTGGPEPLFIRAFRMEMVAAVHDGAVLVRADRLPGHTFDKVLAPGQGVPGPLPHPANARGTTP